MIHMSNISIALTTFNGARYVKEQLESILRQNLDFCEIIICDDNSTDATPDILQMFANSDERVKLHLNSTNLGFKKNFEKAIRLCKGEYIALCDQDDIWLPNHLESLYNGIGDNMLVCGVSEIINSGGERQNIKLHELKNFHKANNNNASIFRFISFYQNPFQGASMMLRRDFVQKVLPIPSDVLYHDVWFAINACLLNSFVFINDPVTLYRMHENNASGSHEKRSVLRTIIGHFLKKNLRTNRKEIFEELINSKYISDDSAVLVRQALRYYKDRSVKTRIGNLIFELSNYQSIYGKK